MGNFWSKKLGGGQEPPPPQPQHQHQQGMAWWQTPASVPVQPATPDPGYHQQDSGPSLTYQQLKSMKAADMSQEHMEMLASMELQGDKYNQSCPQCGSDNFIPAGARAGSARMSTDRCFECGAGVRSPEPAAGGSGNKAGTRTRQLDGGSGTYGQHISQIPPQFVPRRTS